MALADGRILSRSGDSTLRLWDGESGTAVAVLEGHTSHVLGAMALTDRRILSWSLDGALRLWDGETGASVAVLKRHTYWVDGATSLADGRIILWSEDGTLRVWDSEIGTSLGVFATVHDWAQVNSTFAEELASIRPETRAQHHSLHLGYRVKHAAGNLAVFVGGRQLRFCRFIPAQPRSST